MQSHLIAAELHKDARKIKEAYADKGWVFFTTWDDLIERAKQSHNQFREILQKRATEAKDTLEPGVDDDPAIGPSGPQPTNKARKKADRKKGRSR